MEYLVTADEMKQYDTNTIEVLGIPGMVLMERAALAAFEVLTQRFGAGESVLILAGTGNNGGDGLALARLLCEAGYRVTVRCIGDADRASEQWKLQKKILEHFPVSFSAKMPETEYTIMVDALFGVGLSRNIEGEYAQAIADFNRAGGFKLALDIPSGIHSDTGGVMGCAASADVTITFGFLKRGLVFFPGAEYVGEVIRADIGITDRSFLGREPGMYYYNETGAALMPGRQRHGNKGTFGKVLLVAGSPQMAGAAVLAAKAAYRTGAGMVKVITAPENREILQTAVPEVLYGTYEVLDEALDWADVIVIGPGLGQSKEAGECLYTVIIESSLPIVIDADGLNILAKNGAMMEALCDCGRKGRSIIMTPHVGELSRLLQEPVAVLKQDLAAYGKALAAFVKGVVVAKDARTFTCRAEGTVCVNRLGNSGMATAGSGDVLTGVIAALLAQKMTAFEAAAVGVYLHAKAGDGAAAERGEYALMAGDIVEALGRVTR